MEKSQKKLKRVLLGIHGDNQNEHSTNKKLFPSGIEGYSGNKTSTSMSKNESKEWLSNSKEKAKKSRQSQFQNYTMKTEKNENSISLPISGNFPSSPQFLADQHKLRLKLGSRTDLFKHHLQFSGISPISEAALFSYQAKTHLLNQIEGKDYIMSIDALQEDFENKFHLIQAKGIHTKNRIQGTNFSNLYASLPFLALRSSSRRQTVFSAQRRK